MRGTSLLFLSFVASVYAPDPHGPDPHAPDPHAPDPHAPDPHAPDPHASDPHAPDCHGPDPHAPDHHAPDCHAPDPHAPDPHAPDPHAPDPHAPDPHAPDCHGHDCDLIRKALTDIGMNFDVHICDVFRGVNCVNHLLLNDEQICGSDGKTYNNHCLYAKARCIRILDHHPATPLSIAYHRACGMSTLPPLTATAATTTTSTTTTSTSGSLTMAAIATASGTTTKRVTQSFSSTTGLASAASPFTTVSASTTASSVHNILGGVFCQYRNNINCKSTLNVVCGSDGKFYPNVCELLKVQCDIPTLREDPDSNNCSLSP